jgi:flagellar assembly factor FliW
MADKKNIQITTSRFGRIEVQEIDLISFPKGIVGFPELKKYVLIDHEKNSAFKWLQSIDNPDIAFVLTNPLLFKPEYRVEVHEGEVEDLNIKEEKDAIVSVIITIPSNPEQMTANLRAPIVFNLPKRTGKQVILNKSEYNTRHKVLEELRSNFPKKEANSMAEWVVGFKPEPPT